MQFSNFAESQPHVQPIQRNVQRNEQPPQQSAAREEWLSPKKVAERAGIHVQTLRRYIREGHIPYHQLAPGMSIRIEWNAFVAALKKIPNSLP